MTWETIAPQLFTLVIFPLIGILTVVLIAFLSAKKKQIKENTDNELLHKYIDMLDKTIVECVLTTTQTYVESLKKQGAFDAEAQKKAFEETYSNVMLILSTDAVEYLQEAMGDLQTYVFNKIESTVLTSKSLYK